MTRRRHALSGNPSEHHDAFADAEKRLAEFVEKSDEAMDASACLLAGMFIDKAYIELGMMKGNAGWGGAADEQKRINAAEKSIRRADEPFESGCVRLNPRATSVEQQVAYKKVGLAGAEASEPEQVRKVESEMRRHGFTFKRRPRKYFGASYGEYEWDIVKGRSVMAVLALNGAAYPGRERLDLWMTAKGGRDERALSIAEFIEDFAYRSRIYKAISNLTTTRSTRSSAQVSGGFSARFMRSPGGR